MTELEKKILLTEEEYYYLMEHLGHDSPLFPKPIVKQINYYFDTDDLSMNRQNTTCRIRLKDGKYNYSISIMGGDGGDTEIYAYVKINGDYRT